jgi:hypothetical protein
LRALAPTVQVMTQDHLPRGAGAPIASLRGESAEATQALRTMLYLRELDRQATIFGICFDNALSVALLPTTAADDVGVWANLQGALFAAIVVQRVLQPVEKQVRKHPHHEVASESQRFAAARGKHLRELLSVPDDAPLFSVSSIRNDFEHVDERLDGFMREDVHSVSDWYISDGMVLQTGPTGYGLRVFLPNSGTLLRQARARLVPLGPQHVRIEARHRGAVAAGAGRVHRASDVWRPSGCDLRGEGRRTNQRLAVGPTGTAARGAAWGRRPVGRLERPLPMTASALLQRTCAGRRVGAAITPAAPCKGRCRDHARGTL